MKILSVKLKNIASIDGEYLIDFETGKLGANGLFCITGPTGAGKSTLLDAICLALYARTPRYDKCNLNAGVKPQEINPDDVRNVLHRGAKDCFSEVTFLGADNKKYAARWSIELNRNGGFRAPQFHFIDFSVSTTPIPDKRDVILTRVRDRIGLTYDQFIRTVLLAQNDFAAFLTANENEKSDLLEKLTGTQIYAEISKEIFQRSKTATEAFKMVSMKVDNVELLSDEDFAKKQEEQLLLKTQKEEQDKQQKGLETSKEEYQTKTQELDTFQRASQSLEDNLKLLNEKKEGLLLGEKEAKDKLTSAQENQKKNAPLLQEARKLELSLSHTQEELKKSDQRLTKDRSDIEKQKQETLTLKAQLKALNEEEQQVKNYFVQQQEHLQMLERSPEVKVDLNLAKQYRDKGIELQQKFVKDKNDLAELEKKIAAEKKQLAPLDAKVKELTDSHLKQSALLEKIDFKQLNQQVEQHNQQLEQLRNNLRIWKKVYTIYSEQNSSIAQGKQTKELRDLVMQQMTALDKDIKLNSEELNKLKALHDKSLLIANQGVAHLREKLVEGEECPVCGATHHPFADKTKSELEQVIQQENESYRSLEKGLEEKRAKYQQLNADYSKYQLKIEELKNQIQKNNRELEEHKAEYVPLFDMELMTAALSPDEYAESIHLFEQKGVALHQKVVQLKEKQAEYTKMNRELSDLQKKKDAAIAEKDKKSRSINTLEVERGKLETSKKNSYDKCKEERALYDKIMTKLQATITLANWRESFEESMPQFIQQFNQLVEEWSTKQKRREEISQQQNKLTPEIKAADSQIKAAEETIKNTEKEREELAKQNVELSNQRKAIFEGREVNEVEESLNRLIEQSQTSLEAAKKALQENALSINTSKTQLEEKSVQLKQTSNWLADWTKKYNTIAELEQTLEEVKAKNATLTDELTAVNYLLTKQQENLKKISQFKNELEQKRTVADQWNKLSIAFGSADGMKLKRYAQKYALEILVRHANKQMELLTNRYRLVQSGEKLGLEIVDLDMCNEHRPVNSLSGGETFLVSLGLALGLASLSSNNLNIGSLFIDEGFGSLDPHSLRVTMDALEQLQSQGRKVGVISHVEELRERIPAQIQVIKKSNGRSKLLIPA